MKSNQLRWGFYLVILIVIVIAAIVLSLSIGEITIPFNQLPTIFSQKDSMEYGVLFYIRIPRTLLGFAVGGSLSLAGAILQGIYRNPLVEPYTLGISGGASLGVTFVLVAGLNVAHIMILPIAGFIGAFVTIFLVYSLSIRNRELNVNRMLLIGVMISFISSSLMMFLMSITSAENIHGIVFWMMGSLNESNQSLIVIMLVLSLLCLAVSYLFVMPLNALRLGEERAKHLGVNSNVIIRILFIITSILTGVAISVAGVIGFVGLVIPHIVRLWVGSDYRIMLIASFLSGSTFLLVCDVIARTIISPNELPIGVITGIVGGIMFILLLSKPRRKSKALT